MSNFKKTPARTTRSAALTHKPGSKSPKHRGYRPAEATAAPAKKRWNAEDRAKRAEAPRADRADRRPDWQPGGTKPRRSSSRVEPVETRPHRSNADRPEPRRSSAERGSAYRDQRPARDDRPQRADRPRYDRAERPQRDDRPRYDRAEHSEHRRPGADRPARDDRPSRGRRDERTARDQRPQRADRPRRDSDFYPKRDAATRETRFTAHEDVVLERLEADAIQASDVVGVTFADLGLGANIVRELSTLGAESPFPIQAATIPDVLKGMDVLGRGKTGSGKTIAFGAPLVERLMENGGGKGRKPGRNPRALILAPTRELALQIDRTIQPIARSVGLFTTQIYGGVPQHRQVTALQRGVDIVIGTPGRIEDLIEQGRLDLSDVAITVLDEADHMCDLGFLEPVQRILNETVPGGQKLLFSATLDKGVASLVDEFLVNPSVHEVAGEDQASSTIDHRVLLIEQSDKRAIIEKLSSGAGKTLIFARTRAFAEQLADDLDDAGIPAVSLHGDLNQARRTRNLEKLTSGRVSVLVATDVAARGIHVDDISLVIQADPPDEYKSYLHRAGRTGRAGKAGTVVTLVNSRRRRKMDELLGRAEISPRFDHVRPGDELLEKLAAL
ncbi:MAG TPA: DEAD/DEAH box helicase [Terrimesophilobacter sp.]|nr:DEAD/DEAH box helicase [Terrimesophilobacter sp.]